MVKYQVHFTRVDSSFVTVEAADEEEARETAWNEFESPFLCAQCSGWGHGWSVDAGEWEQDESDEGVREVESDA